MLLILQIILTIIAWRNGWKWKSLLPVGILLLVSLIVGFMISASGDNIDSVQNHILVLDITSIFILLIMSFKSPQSILETNDKTTKLD